jgi:hypothetical protein
VSVSACLIRYLYASVEFIFSEKKTSNHRLTITGYHFVVAFADLRQSAPDTAFESNLRKTMPIYITSMYRKQYVGIFPTLDGPLYQSNIFQVAGLGFLSHPMF